MIGPNSERCGDRASGFTLVELVIALVISSTVGLAIVQVFRSQLRFGADTDTEAETHQGLAMALDSLSRDVRLAGACLPVQPLFVPIAGTDSGTTDSITVRTGIVSATTTCVQGRITAVVNPGAQTLAVDNVAGFTVNGLAYVVGAVPGEFIRVTAVSAASGPGSITTDSTLAQTYPIGAGAFGLEERAYAIDTTTYAAPTLTRSFNRQPALPIASGIEALDIRYRLSAGCPSCTVVNLPSDNPTWMQVSEVILRVNARSLQTLSTQALFRDSATVTIQPRNILTLRAG